MKPGVVLRGAGATKTHIRCDFSGTRHHSISITEYDHGTHTPVTGGCSLGSTRIQVSVPSRFKAGDKAVIQQLNDAGLMYTQPEWKSRWERSWQTDWLRGAVGQVVRIKAVEGSTITLESPLHYDFKLSQEPTLSTTKLISGVGIEDLHLVRPNGTAPDWSHNINMQSAERCWVRRIHSDYVCSHHVQINQCINIEIRDSYFHHGHKYTGGKAYGVALFKHSTSCLIENNIFKHLRHSMSMVCGPNGNVWSCNYSMEPYAIHEGRYYYSHDISVHGYYSFMNLFEGNIVQYVGVPDYWGPVGSTTFLRNRVQTKNLAIIDHSHNQNIVGNEFTSGSNRITEDSTVNGTLKHGNNENGTITWEPGLPQTIPTSLYYTSKPPWFGNHPFPDLGGDLPLGRGTNPAKTRWDAGIPVPPPPGPEELPPPEGLIAHW